jgi:triacylglycerol esterase/lipase EstA (alpha/beta hydrolase family)
MSDGIVILHGIFRTHRSMRGVTRFFDKQGYKTLNLGYPSTRHDLIKLAEWINPPIQEFAQSVDGKLHFLGYSMGGLLVRTYLKQFRPGKLGRVVLVGTPNNGSEIADFVQAWPLYKRFYGPAGQQLITKQDAFKSIFGAVDYELGVIAGNRTIDPLGSYIIGKPSDGKVSIESTKLEGMKAHLVLPANHTFFPDNRRMWKSALQFIKTGSL